MDSTYPSYKIRKFEERIEQLEKHITELEKENKELKNKSKYDCSCDECLPDWTYGPLE